MNIIVIIIILIVLYWQVKSIFHNKAKLAKTIIVLLLLIFISTPSYALSEFTCIFTMFNPSATNIAFGLESGTANIWDRNPLGVWSNPAKLGYYNGFAYGNTHDSWLEGFIKGIYHDSSYLTFGWNGVGILLPFVNNSGRFGTTLDYGEQEAYDAEGNPFIKFNSYETNSKYAVGINCIELTSRILKNIPQLRNMKQYAELSFGYSLDYIVSGLCPLIPELMDAEGKGKSCAHNFGSLIKINLSKICYEIFKFDNLLEEQQNEFSFNDILNFEVVGGINFINISKAKILYENSEHKQPLPYGNNTAIAGKLSLINLYNLLPKDFRFLCFFNNMFSIYASYDNAKYGDNPSTWSEGIEFIFLDIFSLRRGKYYDYNGHIVGDSKGWGINLNYKDVVSFQYNYVEFPGGELQAIQKKADISFSIDILQLIKILK